MFADAFVLHALNNGNKYCFMTIKSLSILTDNAAASLSEQVRGRERAHCVAPETPVQTLQMVRQPPAFFFQNALILPEHSWQKSEILRCTALQVSQKAFPRDGCTRR